jgi:hypothetical protein
LNLWPDAIALYLCHLWPDAVALQLGITTNRVSFRRMPQFPWL